MIGDRVMIGDRQFYPSETTEVEELCFFLVRQTAGNNSFKSKIKQKNDI